MALRTLVFVALSATLAPRTAIAKDRSPGVAPQPWDSGVGGSPGLESNYEVKLGEFAYLPPLHMLQPYGDLAGKGVVTRSARGQTTMSMSLWLDETASLPPQTEVTSQLYRGTCEQIALGRNVPYQNPYLCPYNAVSGTVGCSPQQVEVWPSPLEAKMQGNLDAAGRVITNFVWPVHIPATESANVELSLVTFDPSFPPGYFKMACCDVETDRTMAALSYSVSSDLVGESGVATIKARLERTELGVTTLRLRLLQFGDTGAYKIVVQALPCAAQHSVTGLVYYRNASCNRPDADPYHPSCQASTDDNLMVGIATLPTNEEELQFHYPFSARADAQSMQLYGCTMEQDGSCTIDPASSLSCLDFIHDAIFADSTLATTAAVTTLETTVEPTDTEETATPTVAVVTASPSSTPTPGPTSVPTPGPSLAPSSAPTASPVVALDRIDDPGSIFFQDSCSGSLHQVGASCCLPGALPSTVAEIYEVVNHAGVGGKKYGKKYGKGPPKSGLGGQAQAKMQLGAAEGWVGLTTAGAFVVLVAAFSFFRYRRASASGSSTSDKLGAVDSWYGLRYGQAPPASSTSCDYSTFKTDDGDFEYGLPDQTPAKQDTFLGVFQQRRLFSAPKSAFTPASPGRAEAGNPMNEEEQKEVASVAPAKAGTAADIVFDAVINTPAKLAVDAAGERGEQASSPTRPGAAASPAAPAAPPATAAEAVLDALINTPSKMVSEAMAYGQAISPYGLVMDALGGLLG